MKKIEDIEGNVVSKAVNSAKEHAAAAASKQVADFAITHLKGYITEFFKSFLVGPFSEI